MPRALETNVLSTFALAHVMEKERCIRLIQLYSTYRGLWDSRCPDYYNRGVREEAWKNISRDMNLPKSVLKKKMDSLLGSYRREKSREKRSRIAGSGISQVYTSNWYAYECFNFLGDRNIQEKMENNLLEEAPQQSDSAQIENDITVDRKICLSDPLELEIKNPKLIETVQDLVRKCERKTNSFGLYVGEQLEELNKFQRQVAEKLISDVLFLAKTGNLNYDTRVETHPTPHNSLSCSFSQPPSPLYMAPSSSKLSENLTTPQYVRMPPPPDCHSSSSS